MELDVQQQTGEKLMKIVMFTLVLSAMSVLMFNFVLPQISEEFGLTNAQVSWVTSSYALIYGIGTIIYGKLADHYKLKDLLTFGLLLFAIGSLIGLTSQTFWMVLVGRCIQAMGAAAIPAIAMLIPIRYFPPERRGSAMGLAFVGLALGSALGPVMSALILSVVHWRWLFCIPLFILITLPFYRKYLGDERGSHTKLDWMGGGLLAASVTLLLLGVTVGAWLFVIGGLLSLVLFIVRIRSVQEPFIQPGLFSIKNYTIGLVITFLISGIGFSLYYLSPLLLADIHQLPPSWIGFALVPGAAASAILGRSGGRLADLKGNSYLFFIASMLLVSCFVLLSTFTGVSPVLIAIFLILGNVGQTFMMIAMSNSVSMTLSKKQAGVGMGLLTMLNFIGGGMATGVYGKMVDLGSAGHWNPVHHYSDGAIYSNIFLILAVLHVGILSLYVIQFNRGIIIRSKIVGEDQTVNEK
ncbi:MFS transporter [Alkalihalobacillus sp. TS-13]|uniref:MFS transporter n=1 Tax=Alkalihalobacillus sp. TS-13 TaxID=2842455 RepID=UPI001C88BEB0|nr:MFS transporter [Alkalihalobacillus sp. TS-13]